MTVKGGFKLTSTPDCRVPSTLEEVASMERPPQMKACRALIRQFAIDLNQRAGLHIDDVVQLFSGVPEWVTSQRHVWERSQVKIKWWRCCDCGTIDREKAFFDAGTIATCPKCGKVNAVKISEEMQENIEAALRKNPTLDGGTLISKTTLPPAPMPPFDCPSVDTCGLQARWDSCFDCPSGHGPKSQEKPGDRKAPFQLKLSPCPICMRDSLHHDGKCEACGADLGGVNMELIRAARTQRIGAERTGMIEMAQRAMTPPMDVSLVDHVDQLPPRPAKKEREVPVAKSACACDGHTCPVCSTAGTESRIIDHYCHECGTKYCPTCHNIVKAVMAQAYSSCGKCSCKK